MDTDLEKPRPILKPKPKLWTKNLKNLDPEKPGPCKTWILKDLDPEKLTLIFYEDRGQYDLLFTDI